MIIRGSVEIGRNIGGRPGIEKAGQSGIFTAMMELSMWLLARPVGS